MIKQTYKSKNGIKTTEKQALPFVQPETETLVEAVLSASQVSLAAGASAPSGASGPPPHQVIKLGIDVHLDRYVPGVGPHFLHSRHVAGYTSASRWGLTAEVEG